MFLLIKAIVSAFTIILITTVAKKTSLLGGLVAIMPFNIILSLIWLDFENKDNLMLTGFLKAAIIGVIPTVLFLIIVFYLLNKQTRISLSLIIGICFLGTFAFLQYKLLKTF